MHCALLLQLEAGLFALNSPPSLPLKQPWRRLRYFARLLPSSDRPLSDREMPRVGKHAIIGSRLVTEGGREGKDSLQYRRNGNYSQQWASSLWWWWLRSVNYENTLTRNLYRKFPLTGMCYHALASNYHIGSSSTFISSPCYVHLSLLASSWPSRSSFSVSRPRTKFSTLHVGYRVIGYGGPGRRPIQFIVNRLHDQFLAERISDIQCIRVDCNFLK